MPTVIEEYLAHLGFKVDEASWRNFSGALIKSASLTARLGAEASAAAIAVGVAVDLIARRYEQLYYASQRTGASVGALMSYSFAATQIGLSSEAARHSVDAFSQSLRLNPGLQGLLTNLGVGPGDPTDRMINMVSRLKAQFGERGYFAAAQIAGMFGMGDPEFRHMWMNLDRMVASQKEQQDRLRRAGINADEAAAKFTQFRRELNSLGAAFEALGDRIALTFVEPVTRGVIALRKLIDSVTSVVGVVAQSETGKALPGWLAEAVGTTMGMPADVVQGAAGALGLGSPETVSPKAAGSSVGGTKDSIIQYFMAQGWTRAQATGIAANLHMESGFNPGLRNSIGMYGVAQWDTERRKKFGRWAGHAIEGSTLQEQLAFIQYELTSGGEERAGRALAGTTTARQAGSAFSMYYERPEQGYGINAYRRGALANSWFGQGAGGGATIHQNNNITVNGVNDPQTAAGKISEAMDLRNQQLRQMIRGDTVR